MLFVLPSKIFRLKGALRPDNTGKDNSELSPKQIGLFPLIVKSKSGSSLTKISSVVITFPI